MDGIVTECLLKIDGFGTGNVDLGYITPLVTDFVFANLVKKTDALVASNFIDRIISRCYVLCKSDPEADLDKLNYQLSQLKVKKTKLTLPIADATTIMGKTKLSIRVPAYDNNDDEQIKSIAYLVDFALDVLNIERENLNIFKDSSLGSQVFIPAKLRKTIDAIKLSLHTAEGSFTGEFLKLNTKFKGNLVEILAALFLLRNNQDMLKRIDMSKLPQASRFGHVSQTTLREYFNNASGLMDPQAGCYSGYFLKAILSLVTRYTNKSFPGVWIHSLRKNNACKTNEKLFALMGFIPKGTSPHKLYDVIMSDVKIDENKKPKLGSRFGKESQGATHAEFRAGLFALLPLYDPESDKPIKDQLSRTPLQVHSEHTLSYYESNRKQYEKLSIAYALKQSASKKKDDKLLLQYKQRRQEFINSTNDIPLQNINGKKYANYREIEPAFRKHLENLLHRKIGEKRKAQSNDMELESDTNPQPNVADGYSSDRPPKRLNRQTIYFDAK